MLQIKVLRLYGFAIDMIIKILALWEIIYSRFMAFIAMLQSFVVLGRGTENAKSVAP